MSDYFRLFGRDYLKTTRYSLALVLAVAALDCVWRVVLGRTPPLAPPDFNGKKIAVAKLDHLGDLLITSAFLTRLREHTRDVHITLIVGSWCRPLAEIYQRIGLCDAVLTYDAAGCNKQTTFLKALRKQFTNFWSLRRQLRALKLDALIDLRERSPNTLLLGRLSGIPFRAGFGVRGLSFTLHHTFRYDPKSPLGQMYLDAFASLGFPNFNYQRPLLAPPPGQTLPPAVRAGGRYLVIHPASRDLFREAGPRFWAQVFAQMPQIDQIIAVGGRGDRARYQFLDELNDPRFLNLMGDTSLEQLLELVKQAHRAVVIDSFVAHIALAFDVPALLIMAPGYAIANSYPAASPFLQPISSAASEEELTRATAALLAFDPTTVSP